MELHEFSIKIPKRKIVSIIPMGDWHIGSRACNKEKLCELINWIKKTPDVYIIGMGDYADLINLSDPRFDISQIDDDIVEAKDYLSRLAQIQADKIVDLLRPIKHRIIGLGVGNHELSILKKYHYDVMYKICGTLDVKYLGWTSLTRLKIVRENKTGSSVTNALIIFSEHSRVAGRKKGSKINSLEDRSNDFDADIFLRGHSHDKICTTKVSLTLPKRGDLRTEVKKRVYAICPSYFNSYETGTITYGEIAGYPPTSTGVIRIDIELKQTYAGGDEVDYHLYQ